jgi:predicted kinase
MSHLRPSYSIGGVSGYVLVVIIYEGCYHEAMELVIMMGLQASGKSTFSHTRFAGTHVHVSKDALRNNKRPGRRQAHLIEEALGAGQSVVVDNTNPTIADRAELIALGRRYGATVIGYYFEPSVAESLKRNGGRSGKARVPVVAIYATNKRMQCPSYAEGFDELYDVRIGEGGEFVVEPWSEERVDG